MNKRVSTGFPTDCIVCTPFYGLKFINKVIRTRCGSIHVRHGHSQRLYALDHLRLWTFIFLRPFLAGKISRFLIHRVGCTTQARDLNGARWRHLTAVNLISILTGCNTSGPGNRRTMSSGVIRASPRCFGDRCVNQVSWLETTKSDTRGGQLKTDNSGVPQNRQMTPERERERV